MLRYQNFEIVYIEVLFSNVVQHVLKHPDGSVAEVVAPMASTLVRIGRDLCGVHAAERQAALGLRADLVRQVEVDVRQVKNFRRFGSFLKLF